VAEAFDRRNVLVDVLALGLVVGLALAVRSLGLEFVFVGDDVVFPPADPQYHLRRAFFTFVHFPDVLLFDPYINYPGGAPVPWPPLFDWTLGAVARLVAQDVHGFERVAAWASPVAGGLAVVPIALAGSLLGGRRVGLVAGVFYALLPIAVDYGRVGYADHHATVAMIGACLLLVCLASARAAVEERPLGRLAAIHSAIRLVLMLTWHGSPLYLVLSEGLLLGVGIWTGRRELLGAQSLGALATGAILLPVIALSPTPLGGEYSSIALSRLHVLGMLGVAGVSGGLWAMQRRRPNGAAIARLLMAMAIVTIGLFVLLLMPGIREGLTPALRFLTMSDEVGAVTGEQSPLFAWLGRTPGSPAVHVWGWFAYAIPLAPAAAWLAWRRPGADPGTRVAALLLGAWGAFFAFLALQQRRYGNDFAPAAAILFALALCALAERATRTLEDRRSGSVVATALALGLCVLLFLPPVCRVDVPRAQATLHALRSPGAIRLDVRDSVAVTLARFMGEVGRMTPETSSYLTPGPSPEYAVIAHANLGHALQYGARRPTATDPFWWYIGRENWDRSFAFFETADEEEAIRLAELLRGRYVVTTTESVPGSVAAHLHRYDGVALEGRAPLTRFRHVTEAAAQGAALGEIFRPGSHRGAPYKLFEIVEGARLEVRTEAALQVVASITLLTPRGRQLVYQQEAFADEAGIARLRLPYWSRADLPLGAAEVAAGTRARGPWRVRAAGIDYVLPVTEAAVRAGTVLHLDADDAANSPARSDQSL